MILNAECKIHNSEFKAELYSISVMKSLGKTIKKLAPNIEARIIHG